MLSNLENVGQRNEHSVHTANDNGTYEKILCILRQFFVRVDHREQLVSFIPEIVEFAAW